MGLTVSQRFPALGEWFSTHWIGGTGMPAVSVRQHHGSNQWYVVQRFGTKATVLSGPHASVDAAVMLLAMGVIAGKEG